MTVCIECDTDCDLVSGQAIYPHRQDLYSLSFYLCPCCDAYVGCHKGTTQALGTACGPATRQARSKAHAAFDPLWRGKAAKYTRTQAYQALGVFMELPAAECHIGMFDYDQCMQVIRFVEGIV